MLKNLLKSALLLFMAGFLGCSSSNSKPLSIEFSKDSTKILISNIDKPGLLKLQELKPQDSIFSDLVAVLQTPSEKDSTIREELVSGNYAVSDSGIVFSPTQPFVKGREYLAVLS